MGGIQILRAGSHWVRTDRGGSHWVRADRGYNHDAKKIGRKAKGLGSYADDHAYRADRSTGDRNES